MAYASYFDTKVTELRFKCLQWTIYLHNLNNEVGFQIYEDQNNSSIDFEIILRDNEGNNVGNFIVNDIHVNNQLIEVVRHVINIHMYHFGVQVSNFSIIVMARFKEKQSWKFCSEMYPKKESNLELYCR